MYTRRDFIKLSTLFTATAALPLLQACGKNAVMRPDAPLTIGYLPIVDAAPLLVAHGKGLFAQHGIKAQKPVLFRSWAGLVEAFLSGQVNLIHVLSPMSVWMRYGSRAPVRAPCCSPSLWFGKNTSAAAQSAMPNGSSGGWISNPFRSSRTANCWCGCLKKRIWRA